MWGNTVVLEHATFVMTQSSRPLLGRLQHEPPCHGKPASAAQVTKTLYPARFRARTHQATSLSLSAS